MLDETVYKGAGRIFLLFSFSPPPRRFRSMQELPLHLGIMSPFFAQNSSSLFSG
jgi:hypothetical protein